MDPFAGLGSKYQKFSETIQLHQKRRWFSSIQRCHFFGHSRIVELLNQQRRNGESYHHCHSAQKSQIAAYILLMKNIYYLLIFGHHYKL
jgi:hypothetical protein